MTVVKTRSSCERMGIPAAQMSGSPKLLRPSAENLPIIMSGMEETYTSLRAWNIRRVPTVFGLAKSGKLLGSLVMVYVLLLHSVVFCIQSM